MDFNIYNRGTSDDATKERAKKGHDLNRKNMKGRKRVLDGVPPATIVNSFPSNIFYDDKEHNEDKCVFVDSNN